MKATTNYYERSIDLSVFQGIKETGSVLVDQTLFNQGGEVCTGLQKLIQRWLITFLTPQGSVKFHPENGTSFIEEAASFRNEIDAETAFYTCNADACDQLKTEEDDEMDTTECIGSVQLLGITVDTAGFKLSVRITSLAGDSAPLILPIVINPLQL